MINSRTNAFSRAHSREGLVTRKMAGRPRRHHGKRRVKEPEEDYHEMALKTTGKLDSGQQERILASLHPSIRGVLNVHEITSRLNEQGLLTSSENEKLQNVYLTRDEKIDQIIRWIPRKGSDALGRFLICLEKSSNGTGHGELIDPLKCELRKERLRTQRKKMERVLKGGMCYLIRSKWLKPLIGVFTILALLVIMLYFPYVRHCIVWWMYSPSLPSTDPYFVGRDREVEDLVGWLDLEDNEVRAISITGPPGIGKSSLAVQVGHAMIDRGAVVSYIDAYMLHSDDLPGKVLCNAGIAAKNHSYERLLKWIKCEMKYPLVIIIDNCDFLVHSEQFQTLVHRVFENAATTVKIMAVSRQAVDQFKLFKLQEIDSEASCGLLHAVIGRPIDASTCHSIVTLTGHIPLALKLVGAVLKSRTASADVQKIIASLEREFMPTLSFEDIPLDRRVNASISVSLKYLKPNLINLGQYLSLFPSSFSLTDACSVLSKNLNERCDHLQVDLDVLRDRSLLQQQGNKHYQVNDIIKLFFDSKGSQNVNGILQEFERHYAGKLHALSVQFERNDTPVLCELENERRNIHYFLKHICDWCELDTSLSIQLFDALKTALEKGILTIFITESEIVHLLRNIVTCLEQIMQSVSSQTNRELTNLKVRALHIYIYVILHIPLSASEVIPVFERAQLLVDNMSEVATLVDIEMFYYELAHHYSALGRTEDVARCHMKVLVKANELHNCDNSTSCDYDALASAFYHLKNYEVSAYYLHLHLQHHNLSIIQQAKDLMVLHNCQTEVGHCTEASNTARQLLSFFVQLMEANTSDVYANLDLYSEIESTYWFYNWTDEARYIERKLVNVVKEMSVDDVCYHVFQLVRDLFRTRQYGILPEVAQSALDLCKNDSDVENAASSEIAELYLLLGKAEFYNRNRNESLSSLKLLIGYNDARCTHFAKDGCKTMLLQGHIEVACFNLIWEEVKNITHSTTLLIFSDTFDTIGSEGDDSAATIGFLSSQLSVDAPLCVFYILIIIEWCIHLIQHMLTIRFALCFINKVFIFLKLCLLMRMSYPFIKYIYYITHRCFVFTQKICNALRQVYSGSFIAYV